VSSALAQQRAQLGLVVGRDHQVAHRQLERVLLEAVEARPGSPSAGTRRRRAGACGPRLGPLGEVGVDALAVDHQRRQQADVLAAVVAQQLRGDALGALRLIGVPSCGQCCVPSFTYSRRRKWYTSVSVATVLLRPPRLVRCSIATVGGMPKDRVDVRARRRLHELRA
jgi:hypothetical protein